MLKHLKYFIRFADKEKRLIFENAKFLSYPSKTVIFNQGDIADKMYIILKGRVAVEIKNQNMEGHSWVVALLKDGEHFGELGLIN